MPRINTYNSEVSNGPNLALANAAVSAENGAAEARQQGNAHLAKGLTDLGQGISQFAQAKQKIDDNLFLNTTKNEAERMALEANDYALTNPDSAPDGSSMFSDFEEQFDFAADESMDALSGSQKDQAKQVFEAQKNNFRQQLFQQSREKHGQFVVKQWDDLKKGMSLSAFNNPDSMPDVMFRMNDMADTIAIGTGIDPAKSAELKRMASEEIAIQTIQGEIRQRNFAKAYERTTTGDVSSFLDAQKRTALIEIIDREKMQAIDSDLKMNKIQEDKTEDDKKRQQNIIFNNFLKSFSATTSPAQKEAKYNQLLTMRSSEMISDSNFNFANSILQDTKGNYNERLEFAYRDKILRTNAGFEAVQGDIVRDVNNNSLDARTGSELLTSLNSRDQQIKSDPKIKERFNLAEGRLDAAFGKDSFFEPMDQPRKIAKQNAMELMSQLVDQGQDPLEAANNSIRKFGKSVNALPLIPMVDYRIQSDINGLSSAANQLKTSFRNHRISKEDYAKAIKIWKQRQDAVKTQIEIDQAGAPAPKVE